MNARQLPDNFRDLGGIATEDGRVLRAKRLLRSGEVVALSDADKRVLVEEDGLRSLIDLRSAAERRERPDDVLPGVVYYPIDVLKDVADEAPDRKHLLSLLKTPAAVDQFMQRVYRLLITEKSALAGYRQMLDILRQQKEGATLWHCYAGKDRAGVGAAIVLEVLGVPRAAVMADYLQTNKARAQANAALLAQAKQASGMSGEQAAAIKMALEVQAEYLQAAYQAAEKQYGSFEDYLSEGLGVDAAMRAEMRENYLCEPT